MPPSRRLALAPILVAAGAFLLTAAGFVGLRRDLSAERLRAAERAREAVRGTAAALGAELDRLAAEIGARIPDAADAEALGALARERPFVVFAFLLDASGRIRHPASPTATEPPPAAAEESARVGTFLDEAAYREFAKGDAEGARAALEDADRVAADAGLRASVLVARASHELRHGRAAAAVARLEPLVDGEGSLPGGRPGRLARLSLAAARAAAGDDSGARATAEALVEDVVREGPADGVALVEELAAAGALEGDALERARVAAREAARASRIHRAIAAASTSLVEADALLALGDSIVVLGPKSVEGRAGLVVEPAGFLAASLDAAGALARVEGIPVRGATPAEPLRDAVEVAGTGGLARVGLPPGYEAAAAAGARPWILGSLLLLLGGTIAGGAAFAVRAARREVEAAAAQSDFLAGVTHELKTPLASIRLYGEMLEDGRATDEARRREWIGAIRRESERLTALIDRVLAFAKHERGDAGASRGQVAAGDLVRGVAEVFAPVARRAGAPLEVSIEGEGIPILVDPAGAAQAVLDLLDNAVKHGGASAGIELRGFPDGGLYRVEVSDRGPGVSPAEAGAIFERFARGSAARSEARPGLGLGLALARRIVEANGGALEHRAREGGGSVFAISLPRAEPPA